MRDDSNFTVNKKTTTWIKQDKHTSAEPVTPEPEPTEQNGIVLVTGDRLAVIDGSGMTLTTVKIVSGAIVLVGDDGRAITMVFSE